ncbi:unnamed protein product [Clonostachys rosea f. rosea IK726]|uniref:Glutaredoxin domain-containing protein n=2 Tax=Bionectria ochroleuca TaxID=29856 RepID=A0A0B7JX34_BIOOC|nr:unnamed protein product [Clonostachys rosea f. rosea IK726]
MSLRALGNKLFGSGSNITMGEASTRVQELINEHATIVFSKSYCPYCSNTKRTLKQLNADAFVIELDQDSDGSALQDALEDISGQRTVPNIFINKKHIGGNSDLQKLDKAGELEQLLRNAGSLKL